MQEREKQEFSRVGVRLSLDDLEALDRLRAEASRTHWVRGAIHAADAAEEVAQAVREAIPPETRGGPRAGAGGRREGAGRPRKNKKTGPQ